jgi:CCR4-NOT transcriptional complex subunit CAF120
MKTEEWVRVRFGAGVPWKRCWCVISPPDEKDYQKQLKELKKRSPYDRSHPPILKGDIKFYDDRKEGRKQKKAKPIATITDAYSAYALYPQAKSLIDASTLIKIEGNITIHSDPPNSTEGFVFIMPEVHPAVSGFGMMLQFLFPTWDTFGLYGRPGRLVASTLDPRSLMFAMPKHKRYGYLEILDVTSLILQDGSQDWAERDWKKKLKELTGQRMTTVDDTSPSATHSRSNSRTKRLSFGTSGDTGAKQPRVGFADGGAPPSARSSRSMSLSSRPPPRTDSAPPSQNAQHSPPSMAMNAGHIRNASDSDVSGGPPPPLPHLSKSGLNGAGHGPNPARNFVNELTPTPERISLDEELEPPARDLDGMRNLQTPEPVSRPPAFTHTQGDKPKQRMYHSPELRRANSRMSSNTLAQLAQAGGIEGVGKKEGWVNEKPNTDANSLPIRNAQQTPAVLHTPDSHPGMVANTGSIEDLRRMEPQSPGGPPPTPDVLRTGSPHLHNMPPPSPGFMRPGPGSRPGTPGSQDARSPLGPGPGPGPQGRPPPGRGPPNMPPHGRGGPMSPPPNMPPYGRGGPMSPPPNMPPYGRGGPMSPPPRGDSNGPPNMFWGPPGPGSRPGTPSGRVPPPPINTSPPVSRKPLPVRGDSLNQPVPGSPSVSSNGSFTRAIDPAVAAQIRAQQGNTPQSSIRRQDTGRSTTSSTYDSIDSPDYASTRPSTDSGASGASGASVASVERPRVGVLRTVGDETAGQPSNGPGGFEIPSVDFGPTYNYASNSARSKTPTSNLTQPTGSLSPDTRSFSPGPLQPRRSPAPEAQHARNTSEDTLQQQRRSVIWQPATGMSTSSHSGQGISPEQFVQQRAAAASTPLYAHQRQPSGNTLGGYRAGAATPPLERAQGGRDYMHAHARNSSQDLLQRPSSRGAGAVLGGQKSQEASLSAREQEHVARMTGTPLISMAGNKKSPPQSDGLVGAIHAREREKQQMLKQGYGGSAVMQAINQRQQQAVYQQQNMQQPLPSPGLPPLPSGMYSNLGRQSPGPQQSYGYPQGTPNQGMPNQGMSSQGMPNQGMQGWQNGYGSSRQAGAQSPGYMPQQPQYPGQGQRPGRSHSPGFSHPAYQGQAF